MSDDRSDSPVVDVLFFTALKMEYEAARESGTNGYLRDPGVALWQSRDEKTNGPYELGTYRLADGDHFEVALARPHAMGPIEAANSLGILISRVRPSWLVMSGVCAGRPGAAQFGDVIVGSVVYFPQGGKLTKDNFKHDIRTREMNVRWVRAARRTGY